jgi:predicted O-methyltransferase YrrM
MSDLPVFQEWDGYVTSHPLLTKNYQDSLPDFAKSVFDFLCHELGLQSSFEDISLEVPDEWRLSEMASSRLKLNLIGFLLESISAQRVLEVGTFVGLSAMSIANHLGAAGHVDTIEVSQRYAEIARRNLQTNGYDSRVEVLCGDAKEIFRELSANPKYDAVFVDGDKESYKYYLEASIDLVRSGGLIFVDDIFFHGDVFNSEPLTAKGEGARRALRFACSSDRLAVSFIPITNGLLVARVL